MGQIRTSKKLGPVVQTMIREFLEQTQPPLEQTQPPLEQSQPPLEQTQPPLEQSQSSPQPSTERRSDVVLVTLLLLAFLQMILCIILVSQDIFIIHGANVGVSVAALCTFELMRRILFCHARSAFLRRFTDLTEGQILVVNSSRREDWPVYETPRTSRGIRVADVVFRKGGHIASIIFLFFFHQHVTEASLIFVLSVGMFLMVSMQAAFMCWNGAWQIAWYLFGSTDRIRDGRMARHNAISASVALTWGVLTSYTLGAIFIADEDIGLAGDLVILPLTFGDAMGEIVGTPFGKHKFSVKGLGDVNQKSLEGCVAVFLGSLIPTLIATSFYEVQQVTWILPFLISILTTIVETVSFRSTDNFTIPVLNCLAVLIWVQYIGL